MSRVKRLLFVANAVANSSGDFPDAKRGSFVRYLRSNFEHAKIRVRRKFQALIVCDIQRDVRSPESQVFHDKKGTEVPYGLSSRPDEVDD
jgi:hypothetical protein